MKKGFRLGFFGLIGVLLLIGLISSKFDSCSDINKSTTWKGTKADPYYGLDENEKKERQEKIRQLEEEATNTPQTDYAKQLAIYKDLLTLYPGNEIYEARRNYFFNRDFEQRHPDHVTPDYVSLETACYELGFKYGKCSANSLRGIPCDLENDITIPERCRNKSETQRGIKDGIKSVSN